MQLNRTMRKKKYLANTLNTLGTFVMTISDLQANLQGADKQEIIIKVYLLWILLSLQRN